jgi:hypothetical protein
MNASVLPLQYFVSFASQSSENSFSRYFSHPNFLLCRERALTYFLEIVLDDSFNHEQDFASLALRHAPSGETVEITNSHIYDTVLWLEGLTRELELLWQEGINALVAAYDVRHPQFVMILNAYVGSIQNNNPYINYILAADYWVFLRGKRQRLMTA